jgi:hypothetical protein
MDGGSGGRSGMRLLLCADPLSARDPDPAFDAESNAIRELGLTLDLLDFEARVSGEAAHAARRHPSTGLGLTAYRGWMLPVWRLMPSSRRRSGRAADSSGRGPPVACRRASQSPGAGRHREECHRGRQRD